MTLKMKSIQGSDNDYQCTNFGQNLFRDVDSRVSTRTLRTDGMTDGRTVALQYPFATSLARG